MPGNTLVGAASPFGQIEDAAEGITSRNVDETAGNGDGERSGKVDGTQHEWLERCAPGYPLR